MGELPDDRAEPRACSTRSSGSCPTAAPRASTSRTAATSGRASWRARGSSSSRRRSGASASTTSPHRGDDAAEAVPGAPLLRRAWHLAPRADGGHARAEQVRPARRSRARARRKPGSGSASEGSVTMTPWTLFVNVEVIGSRGGTAVSTGLRRQSPARVGPGGNRPDDRHVRGRRRAASRAATDAPRPASSTPRRTTIRPSSWTSSAGAEAST